LASREKSTIEHQDLGIEEFLLRPAMSMMMMMMMTTWVENLRN